jgi:NTE family protein
MSVLICKTSAVRQSGYQKTRGLAYKLPTHSGPIERIYSKSLSIKKNRSHLITQPTFTQIIPSLLENYWGLLFSRVLQKRRYSKAPTSRQHTHIFKSSISCLHLPRKSRTSTFTQKAFIHTTKEITGLQSQKQCNKLLALVLAVVTVTAILLSANMNKAEAQEAELPLVPLSDEELTQLASSLGIPSDGLGYDSLKKLCFQVLVEACIKEEWEKVSENKSLVARLTDTSGKTLFLRMVDEGRKKQIEHLIQRRLEYRYCDLEGNNGLHVAAANGYAPLIPLLIGKFRSTDTNKIGRTALHLAIENGNAHVVGILRERAHFTPWISPEGVAYSPLYLAVQSESIETIDKVLEENSKQLLDPMPPEVGTVLHLAIKTGASEDCSLLKHLLTKYHKETEFLLNQVDKEDRTPLHLAAYEGIEAAIEFLVIQKKVPVNQANSRGRTAVHWAALGEKPDAITRLYLLEANLMQVDYQHHAPLLLLGGKTSLEASECAAKLETLSVQLNREPEKPHDYAKRPPRHLIFQGGGAKGIAYVGIIKALEDLDSMGEVTHIAGTSAGAITAALVAVGYNSKELNQELALKDFEEFLDPVSNMHAGILETMKTGNMIPAITSILKDYWTGTSSLNPIAKAKALNNRLLGIVQK